MIPVLFSARDALWTEYHAALTTAATRAGLILDLTRDVARRDARYLVVAPNGPITDFAPYSQAKAVLNLWAGVEDIVGNPTLTQPLARMVDPGLTEGMVEWVTGHVLRHHLGMDAHIVNPNHDWTPIAPPLARDRKVTILGLGALGAACAQALITLNFDVLGWSRRAKSIPRLPSVSGPDGLTQALTHAEILVLLLPLTPATEGLLDQTRLAQMPPGGIVLNPGRGALIDDAALLAALNSGHIQHATLDVFRTEPLPRDHPYWAHPQVTVTPHIASETRATSAAQVIVENIRRGERGEPFLNLVDRTSGY